jgi:glyoxylase-like metal-dependent hydrolase (beta-lactamase superfamily II)
VSDLNFDRSLEAPYGVEERLTPLIGRVLAPNPGPFTFKGTGVYLLGAGTKVVVIDPGPDMPEHRAALVRALDGRAVSHILITHTHRDHSPAAAWLKEHTDARTFAFGPHPRNDRDVEAGGDRGFVPDVMLRDGDVVEGDGFTLDVLHTPGHISNHLCFALREERALFTGDHVMGWSTSIVAPPDGNMGDYIRGLERLIARDDAVLYPTHGAPIANPRAFLRASLTHRRMREAQIRDALAAGVDNIPAIVARLYPDLAPKLTKAAGLMVWAHLEHLREQGRAHEQDGRWISG